MKCPHCDVPLLISERRGVEIDYCGQCRGIWLDRGELDKIIDMSAHNRGGLAGGRYDRSPNAHHHADHRQHRPHGGYQKYRQQDAYRSGYGGDQRHHKYKKRKSILGEIFDIFD